MDAVVNSRAEEAHRDVQVEWESVECYGSVRLTSFQQDLVVSFFPFYLIRLTYDSHAVPMLLFFSSHHAACTPHPLHLRAVHGYTLLLHFHSATAVRLPYVQLRFHFMAVLDARSHLRLLGSGIL